MLASETPLPSPVRCVGEWLVRWAVERPTTTWLAERDASGAWRRLDYASALRSVEAIATALLERGALPERPVMIVGDNGIAHALVALAAMHVGVPVAPVSPAYALQSRSFDRLRDVTAQLRPAFVLVDDRERYAPALAAVELGDAQVLAPDDVAALTSTTAPSVAMREAFARVGPDTIAKVLFTSGSTGRPKGIVNTQRMLTANQESLAACWPFLATRPQVVVDWLPWSHTFGGNHNFFMILRAGGTLYVDAGRPVPQLIDTTIANLAEISPTIWFNVPRGFEQAAERLARDETVAARVFANLDVVFYAAAALGPATRAALERIAARAGRADVFFTSAWGTTETSPLATAAHFATHTTGVLGVPVPGVELALVPVQDRLELRVRGPNVTPGTWLPGGAIEPAALDDDGFLCTGDAGRLVRDDDANAGVAFVGRLAENFKLSSGTWVNVAQVRLAVVDACAPLIQDVIVAGHDRAALGVLLVPAPAAAQRTPVELALRLGAGIAAHNRAHPSNSERIARARVSRAPLSLDAGETTDKGYTNQRRVLEHRADEVEALFAEPPGSDVLVFPPDDVPFDLAPILNAFEDGWNAAMGLRFERAVVDEVVASLTIGAAHRMPYGIVHGGVYAGMVETVASVGAAISALADDRFVVGLDNHTSFVHAVREGQLRARSRPITRGRRTQLWEVTITDDAGRVVATGRVRLLCLEPEATVAGATVASSRA